MYTLYTRHSYTSDPNTQTRTNTVHTLPLLPPHATTPPSPLSDGAYEAGIGRDLQGAQKPKGQQG